MQTDPNAAVTDAFQPVGTPVVYQGQIDASQEAKIHAVRNPITGETFVMADGADPSFVDSSEVRKVIYDFRIQLGMSQAGIEKRVGITPVIATDVPAGDPSHFRVLYRLNGLS